MSSEGTPGSIPTSASFLEKLKNEDPGPRNVAWEQFQKRYAPIIAGFARNMGARPQEIDDLVQDVMLNFFRGARSFTYDGGKGRFRGYLKTCTSVSDAKRSSRPNRWTKLTLSHLRWRRPGTTSGSRSSCAVRWRRRAKITVGKNARPFARSSCTRYWANRSSRSPASWG